jgi:outer membrane protein insertion porin family
MGVALKVAIVFAEFSDVAYSDPSLAPRVGRIFVEGNRVTADRVILNQMGLYSGQTLRPSQLRRARRKLVRLGIFDAVEVTAIKSDSVYKDIQVRVKEQPTGMVGIGAGVNANANRAAGK